MAQEPGNKAGEEPVSFPGYHVRTAQEPGNEAGEEPVSFPGYHVRAAQEPGNEAGEELASFPGYHVRAAQEPGNKAEGQSNKASRRQCAQDSDLVMNGCNERVTCLHAR